MQTFRFLMNRRERSRADARLADALALRERLDRMDVRSRVNLLEQRMGAMRHLRRGALIDTIALGCLALACITLAVAGVTGLGVTARLVLLVLLTFPAYRLVNVMDTSQRAYHAVRSEVDEILKAGVPEASRFANW